MASGWLGRQAWPQKVADVILGALFVPREKITSHPLTAFIEPYLWVNQQRLRFWREDAMFKFPLAVNVLTNRTHAAMFVILDGDTKESVVKQGVHVGFSEVTTVTEQ